MEETTRFKTNSDKKINFFETPKPLSSIYAVAFCSSLFKSSLEVYVNEMKLTALMDSGSSKSYINSSTCEKLGLKITSSNHNVHITSTAMKVKPFDFYPLDIIMSNKKYEATRLNGAGNKVTYNIQGIWTKHF